MTPIQVMHFSDVLCVWAYVAQVRVAELKSKFPGEVVFDYRYFSVFGDVETKMEQQWQDRGGLPAYAAHVCGVAEQFEHVHLHRDVWTATVPTTSMPAHLVLCAARLIARDRAAETTHAAVALDALDGAIRRAFFEDGIDISRTGELLAIVERRGFDRARVESLIESGAAHAAMCTDLQRAAEQHVRASPTMIFNEGRQTLTGNVGYRVLEANVRELLRHPAGQQSWC
jgi:predicted DsbA family dithiol-disulfide isomerase